MPGDIPPLVQDAVLSPDLYRHLVAAVPAGEEAAGDDVVLARGGDPHRAVPLDVGGGPGGGDAQSENIRKPLASVPPVVVPPKLDPSSSRGKEEVVSVSRLEAILILQSFNIFYTSSRLTPTFTS